MEQAITETLDKSIEKVDELEVLLKKIKDP